MPDTKKDLLTETIDAHTGTGVNEYGCVCGWQNPDGTFAAQLAHAAEMVRKAIHTPEVTEAARREVRALLPDLRAGKDVTVAIAVLDGALRTRVTPRGDSDA
jgi:hypothetical protein